MRENVAIQAERKRLAAEWDTGLLEGHAANVNILPDFFSKPYISLTARQRGYVMGREIRLMDMAEGK